MKNPRQSFCSIFVIAWFALYASPVLADRNAYNPWYSLQVRPLESGQDSERELRLVGNFDYYLFALSWSPAYCLLQGDQAPQDQCGYKRFGFVVHGLWPQFERGYPSNCEPRSQKVPDDMAKKILPIMPSHQLIQHEWAKHGTCSGLSVNDYFNAIDKAYSSVNIPAELKDPQTALRINPKDLSASFQKANPGFPQNSVAINCKSGQLTEIHICLDKQLWARECSSEVLKRQCKNQAVLVTPIR